MVCYKEQKKCQRVGYRRGDDHLMPGRHEARPPSLWQSVLASLSVSRFKVLGTRISNNLEIGTGPFFPIA